MSETHEEETERLKKENWALLLVLKGAKAKSRKPRKFWVVCFENGRPVAPIDCNGKYIGKIPDEGMMVYRTKKAASTSAVYQNESYGLDCHARPLDEAVFTNKRGA